MDKGGVAIACEQLWNVEKEKKKKSSIVRQRTTESLKYKLLEPAKMYRCMCVQSCDFLVYSIKNGSRENAKHV